MKHLPTSGLALALLAGVPAWAGAGIASVEVTPNHAAVRIELPGNVKADLDIAFEQALGLTADSLGISARLVNPSDLNLLSRLPSTGGIPAAFPVLITIEPPASGALAFSGIVSIDLHTHNLNYVTGTPLRLFAAEIGKNFQDLTGSMGMGSMRTGGSKGGFSEFLIASDLRPIATVIDDKFKRLQGILDANAGAIPGALAATLQTQLRAARTAYDANDPVTASDRIGTFADTVKQNSGASIPDVWRSARDVTNVAGDLRAGAATLKFSLLLKASGGS